MDDLGLLRLQMEWGADEALEDQPLSRLRPVAPAQAPMPVAPRPVPTPVPAPASGGGAAERAVALASQATSLESLRAALAAFDGCPLRDTATNLVFAAGDPNAGCLVIGDPPRADDDRSAQAFSGTDGALFDTMLASAGLDRARLLLTPVVPWRPPGERPVNAPEMEACLPFLHRLIALTRPRLLVLAGPQAVRAMVGTRPRVQDGVRMTTCRIPSVADPIEAIVLPFPATAMRMAAARKEAWAALRRIRRILGP